MKSSVLLSSKVISVLPTHYLKKHLTENDYSSIISSESNSKWLCYPVTCYVLAKLKNFFWQHIGNMFPKFAPLGNMLPNISVTLRPFLNFGGNTVTQFFGNAVTGGGWRGFCVTKQSFLNFRSNV